MTPIELGRFHVRVGERVYATVDGSAGWHTIHMFGEAPWSGIARVVLESSRPWRCGGMPR